MKHTAYKNALVLQNGRFQKDLAVVVRDSIIESIVSVGELPDSDIDIVDLDGNYMLPGFIDTQVNGGGGLLFNNSLSVDDVATISAAHRQFGTTGLLPTLVSDDLDVIQSGLSIVSAAIDSGVPGVLGIHIEGPFINTSRRGIHSADKLTKLTAVLAREIEPLANGPTILTLAPETVSPGTIGLLAEKGFIVSAGHTNADYSDIVSAIDQGLTGFTHLFNAMSQLTAREPGVVGAALESRGTYSGIIADNHHVADAALQIAFRCLGPEQLMLVTDAMPVVGSTENSFTFFGKEIRVEDGRCTDTAGTLAGTCIDMTSALRNVMAATQCSLAEAAMMASSTPAKFLGLQDQVGSIEVGLRADFVVLDAQLASVRTIVGGHEF